jgi:hypothetical protein
MFETNNLEIAVASPVEDYFLAMDELPPEGPERAITDPLLDALDTKVRSIHWSPYDRVGDVDADP